KGTKRKSCSDPPTSNVPKRSKSGHNHPNHASASSRIHSFMVTPTIGIPLDSATSIAPLSLAETIRDAIRCHRSLYERASILHSDMSTTNIMMTRPEDRARTELAGFLIDLDYSQYVVPASSLSSPLSCGKTG